jgi:hypothetical protein
MEVDISSYDHVISMTPGRKTSSHAQIPLYPSNMVKQVLINIARITRDIHEVESCHLCAETLPCGCGFHNPTPVATAKVKNI